MVGTLAGGGGMTRGLWAIFRRLVMTWQSLSAERLTLAEMPKAFAGVLGCTAVRSRVKKLLGLRQLWASLMIRYERLEARCWQNVGTVLTDSFRERMSFMCRDIMGRFVRARSRLVVIPATVQSFRGCSGVALATGRVLGCLQ